MQSDYREIISMITVEAAVEGAGDTTTAEVMAEVSGHGSHYPLSHRTQRSWATSLRVWYREILTTSLRNRGYVLEFSSFMKLKYASDILKTMAVNSLSFITDFLQSSVFLFIITNTVRNILMLVLVFHFRYGP